MDKKDFLLEIGCEEIPADVLQPLSKALGAKIVNELAKRNLPHQEAQLFATPRRLAVLIPDLASQQPGRNIERLGPNIDKAFSKDGTPTLACMGFARSCGVSIDQLQTKVTDKGERICCIIEEPGKNTADLLADIVTQAVNQLPILKPMRWGNCDFEFIRPIKWVVMLYGSEIINSSILGKTTTRETEGHRFHHPKPLRINQPKDYSMLLYSQGFVVANFQARRELILKQINQLLPENHKAIIDDDLLDEVTALLEWPVSLKGTFKSEFLQVPKEALISSMQTHQKCFPVENELGELQPNFILVSNIESKNPQTVILGNERVINARLADAEFFFHQDQKHSLESRLERLKTVIFQKNLGSMEQKSRRISSLAKIIAEDIQADSNVATRAGLLSKCDLLSEMVYEFPNLQGIMGYYYALNDDEPKESALAIREHYYPRFSGDKLPSSLEGCAIALADRLDTLVGVLGIRLMPTGDKDPYALRRSALGVLRILIEKEFSLDLVELLNKAKDLYHFTLPNESVVDQAFQFMMSRLKSWYLEQNVATEVFEAVIARNPPSPLDFHHRVQAVRKFQTLPESSALAAANKRVSNILKKIDNEIPNQTDDSLFEFDAERKLAHLLSTHQQTVTVLYQQANYADALTQLSELKQPVDDFFDQVMVMVDDKAKRNNRLALLVALRRLFTQVADIALLPGSST